jgi:hypothetical protein
VFRQGREAGKKRDPSQVIALPQKGLGTQLMGFNLIPDGTSPARNKG